MTVTAKLKVQLSAGDVVVAESEDPRLWRRILTAIQDSSESNSEVLPGGGPGIGVEIEEEERGSGGKGVAAFASALGVKVSEAKGACDPTTEPPFVHLDPKCWEAFKKNTPARGPKAVAAAQLAGTLLCLWFKSGGISGRPTQAQALDVLDGIGVVDRNASRAIKNCTWLQSRSDGIQLNPAEMTQAERVARAFITKSKIESSE